MLVLAGTVPASGSGELPPGKGKVVFNGWAGEPIPVHYYLPADAGPDSPIMIVMHGASRDAWRYRDEWVDVAKTANLIIAAPEFSEEHFDGSLRYNLGYVFDEEGHRRPASK